MDMDEEQLWAIGLAILGIVIVGTIIGNILTSLLTGLVAFVWRSITWIFLKVFRMAWWLVYRMLGFTWMHRNTIFIVAVGYFLLARYLTRRG